jgi:peptidyl-prolyl cis-trans isomerase C
MTTLTVSAQTPPPPVKPAPPSAPAVSPTAVAATVNGHPIYEMKVQRALERVPQAQRDEARTTLINRFVNDVLIDLSLRAAGYKVENAEVEQHVGKMKEELKKHGQDFNKVMSDLKVGEAELREHIAADLRWMKYASAQATDKALQDLFNANKDLFDGTTVRVQHILKSPATKDAQAAALVVKELRDLKTTMEAEAAKALAKMPATADRLAKEKERVKVLSETFAKFAREKSECPSKSNGGQVGPFPRALMEKPFADAAFTMQPYQMSDVVQTRFGYHLILVLERKPGREVKFEEIKEVVKEVYFNRLYEGLAAQLRPKASIVVNPAPK